MGKVVLAVILFFWLIAFFVHLTITEEDLEKKLRNGKRKKRK